MHGRELGNGDEALVLRAESTQNEYTSFAARCQDVRRALVLMSVHEHMAESYKQS